MAENKYNPAVPVLSDLQLALAPDATYRRLAAEAADTSWLPVITRLLLLVLTLAVIVPLMATHTITLGLLAVSAAAWCFVPVAQLLMAAVTILPARGRTVGAERALDLWFAGHLPYTAWLLLLPFTTRASQLLHFDLVVITFAAAAAWASSIELAYCRAVLHASEAASRRRVAVHQTLMLTLVLAGAFWAASFNGIASFLAQILAHLRA